jgi:hypothetical protein
MYNWKFFFVNQWRRGKYKYICDAGKLVSKQFEKDSIVIKHIHSAYLNDHLLE